MTASTGLPPSAPVEPTYRARRREFAVACFAGRVLRFGVLALATAYL